jgi:hypothetical protein
MHAGSGVRNFQVTYWGHDIRNPITRRFVDRDDGSFEIHDVQRGEIHALAFADDYAHSEVVNCVVGDSAYPDIVLALPNSIRGAGTVVDAATLEPIVGARVVLWVVIGSDAIAEQGAPVGVDSSGRFELATIAPGLVRCQITAPGYASATPTTVALAGEPLDFGQIALSKRGELDVRLVGAVGSEFADYSCSLRGYEVYPDAVFNAAGVAHFADVAPGAWEVHVNDRSGADRRTTTVLAPASNWVVEIPFPSKRRLVVSIITNPGRSLPQDLAIDCSYVGSSGVRVADWIAVDDNGVARVEHIGGDRVLVEAFSGETEVGAAYFDLESEDNHVELRLDGARHLIRVVDSRGEVLPNVAVTLFDPSLSDVARITEFTNADGLASFVRVPFNRGIVVLERQPGIQLGQAIDLEPALESAIELVFDPTAAIHAQVRDGLTPMPGVGVRITDDHRLYHLADTSTDQEGRLSFGPVSAGHVLIDVLDSRLWREQFTVPARDTNLYSDIQVRRLGTLRIEVRNSTGMRVEGAEVSLRCVDLKCDVREWWVARRITTSSDQFLTSSEGALQINGLPRAQYQWSVGADATGECELIGGAAKVLHVVVP